MWNSQFWIYGDFFRKITSVIENILLVSLYVWTVITFRGIRSPKQFQLRMKPLISAYVGIIAGFVLYYAVFKILLPSVFMPYMEAAIDFRAVIFTIYQVFIFFISVLDFMWITVLLLGARMLYNEHKAAKQKTE
jgi:hydrogenase-4 membrane subunit HyfE